MKKLLIIFIGITSTLYYSIAQTTIIDCAENQTIDYAIEEFECESIQASEWIKANNSVMNNGYLKMVAGNEIVFEEGFEAEVGAEVLADIQTFLVQDIQSNTPVPSLDTEIKVVIEGSVGDGRILRNNFENDSGSLIYVGDQINNSGENPVRGFFEFDLSTLPEAGSGKRIVNATLEYYVTSITGNPDSILLEHADYGPALNFSDYNTTMIERNFAKIAPSMQTGSHFVDVTELAQYANRTSKDWTKNGNSRWLQLRMRPHNWGINNNTDFVSIVSSDNESLLNSAYKPILRVTYDYVELGYMRTYGLADYNNDRTLVEDEAQLCAERHMSFGVTISMTGFGNNAQTQLGNQLDLLERKGISNIYVLVKPPFEEDANGNVQTHEDYFDDTSNLRSKMQNSITNLMTFDSARIEMSKRTFDQVIVFNEAPANNRGFWGEGDNRTTENVPEIFGDLQKIIKEADPNKPVGLYLSADHWLSPDSAVYHTQFVFDELEAQGTMPEFNYFNFTFGWHVNNQSTRLQNILSNANEIGKRPIILRLQNQTINNGHTPGRSEFRNLAIEAWDWGIDGLHTYFQNSGITGVAQGSYTLNDNPTAFNPNTSKGRLFRNSRDRWDYTTLVLSELLRNELRNDNLFNQPDLFDLIIYGSGFDESAAQLSIQRMDGTFDQLDFFSQDHTGNPAYSEVFVHRGLNRDLYENSNGEIEVKVALCGETSCRNINITELRAISYRSVGILGNNDSFVPIQNLPNLPPSQALIIWNGNVSLGNGLPSEATFTLN